MSPRDHTFVGGFFFRRQFVDDVSILVDERLGGGAVSTRLPEQTTVAAI